MVVCCRISLQSDHCHYRKHTYSDGSYGENPSFLNTRLMFYCTSMHDIQYVIGDFYSNNNIPHISGKQEIHCVPKLVFRCVTKLSFTPYSSTKSPLFSQGSPISIPKTVYCHPAQYSSHKLSKLPLKPYSPCNFVKLLVFLRLNHIISDVSVAVKGHDQVNYSSQVPCGQANFLNNDQG